MSEAEGTRRPEMQPQLGYLDPAAAVEWLARVAPLTPGMTVEDGLENDGPRRGRDSHEHGEVLGTR